MAGKGKSATKQPSDPAQGRDPERSRKQLIDATLDSIAESGISDTTVSRIIERAGLSRGMIHLHFGGKENLIAAAAAAFSDIYYAEMERQLANCGDDPESLIKGVVSADLSKEILNERSAAIWHAFRGEARTSPAIARHSDTRDVRLRGMVRDAFAALSAEDEAAKITANEATLGTLALLEGMWIDFLTHPNDFSRETAGRIVSRFLRGLYPGRFDD